MATKKALEHAETFVRDSIAAQRKLGYGADVNRDVYEAAVQQAATAMEPLLRLADSTDGRSK